MYLKSFMFTKTKYNLARYLNSKIIIIALFSFFFFFYN